MLLASLLGGWRRWRVSLYNSSITIASDHIALAAVSTGSKYWSVDTWIHFLGMYCSFCRLDLRFAVREGNGNSSATLLVEGGMRGASKTHQS